MKEVRTVVTWAAGFALCVCASAAVTPWQGVDWQNVLGTPPSYVNGSNHLVVPINETNLGIAWSEKLTPLFPASGAGSFRSGSTPFFEAQFADGGFFPGVASPLILSEHSSPIPGDGFSISCGASGPFYAIAWQNYKTGQQGSFPFTLRAPGVKTVRIVRVDLGIAYRIDVFFNGVKVFTSLQVTDQITDPYLGDVYLAGIGAAGQEVVYTAFGAGLVDPGTDLTTPVDLSGGYLEPSSDLSALEFGFTSASTAEWSPLGATDQVLEKSLATTLADTLEGTYTPFSDALKKPVGFAEPVSGRTFAFNASLSGSWSEGVEGQSEFSVHVFETPSGPGNASVRFAQIGGDFEIALWDSSSTKQDSFIDTTSTSAYRIEGHVTPSGDLSLTVTRANGPMIGSSFTLGPIVSGLTPGNSHGFRAGFETSTALRGRAVVHIDGFVINAPANALYVFTDNPYVQPADTITYRLGMANLAQPVYGSQAFLSNSAPGVQSFAGAGYTALPFSTWIINPITATLAIASGTDFFGPGVTDDANLAGLQFAAANEGAARLLIEAVNGQGIPTRFTDVLGQEVTPKRFSSNVVIVDGTPPQLTSLSATQGGPNLIPGGTAIQGVMDVSVVVADPATGSGLAAYPVLIVDFAPIGSNGGEDVQITMHAGDGNEFRAQVALGTTTPCGPAEIRVEAADDSGNLGLTSGALLVNTAQVAIEVSLSHVQLPTGVVVTRWVQITLGSTGGSNPPIVVDALVAFSDPDGTGVGNTLPASGVAIITQLPCGVGTAIDAVSAKDPLHTLRSAGALTYLGNNQYMGSVALAGGDANNDNVIDVLDFGVFASQYGMNVGANTAISQPPPHADFSANGLVDTADYTFISTQFLMVGDPPPGNWLLAPPTPKKRASVKEMLVAGAFRAAEFDLNGDGWVDYWEIEMWLTKRRLS